MVGNPYFIGITEELPAIQEQVSKQPVLRAQH